MKHKIDNQQDYNLTENQKQVLLTGVFGDGCITNKVKGCSYSTNSIYKEYVEKKKDGRIFYYTYFGKHFGAYKISNLLAKYPINCYNYKLWSSETIQKWSKLEAQLKSEGLTVTPRKFTNMLGKI